MKYYLYQYTHLVANSKSYIGITHDPEQRRKKHADGKSHARAFNSDVKKYGVEAFSFRILAILEESDAARTERAAIEALGTLSPNGYNLTTGAPGTQYQGTPSEETRIKLSTVHKGKSLSPEHRRSMSVAHIGKKHSVETCQKISSAHRVSPKAQKHLVELHNAKIGVPQSLEHRQNMSSSLRNSPKAQNQRAKLPCHQKHIASLREAQHE